MARNPNKQTCARPGCRCWAMRGRRYCAAHRNMEQQTTPPAEETATEDQLPETGEDRQVIETELRELLQARERFRHWVEEIREGNQPGVTPAEFLRAWNDSTSRVVQLLRARRDLAGGKAGVYDALVEEVLDELSALANGAQGQTT